MARSATHAQRGSIGGLRNAALAPDPRTITQAARDARDAKFRAEVLDAVPGLTDEAEIARRVGLLRRAEMTQLSLKAAKARRLRAQAAAIEAELDVTDIEQSGSADLGGDG